MFPRVEIEPRSGLELVLIALATALALGAAMTAARTNGDSDAAWARRTTTTFAAYFGAGAALILTYHAAAVRLPLELGSYSLLLLGGTLAAWSFLFRRLPAAGIPRRSVPLILVGTLVVGLVGSKLAEVCASIGSTDAETAAHLATSREGFGVFGAIFADLLYLALLARSRRFGFSLPTALDAGSSGILLNIAVARLGCLCAGCCFGAPLGAGAVAHLPFSLPASAFALGSSAGLAYAELPGDAAVWATALLESLATAVLAVVTEIAWRRRARWQLHPGDVGCLAGVGYGMARASLETVRADSAPIVGHFTIWSFTALALGLAAAAFALHSRLPRGNTAT